MKTIPGFLKKKKTCQFFLEKNTFLLERTKNSRKLALFVEFAVQALFVVSSRLYLLALIKKNTAARKIFLQTI